MADTGPEPRARTNPREEEGSSAGTPTRRGFRRLSGLDRSGPEPAQTRAGQPLRPFTLPNAVGFLRLALLPVFLILAFGSDDGRGTAIALIYWLIAAGDYADGLLARLTGQYSRLGALLDPVIDRLTILSGAVVCWHFQLLPRWLIAALAVRELATVLLAQWGLRRGIDIEVNWPGRIAVFPVMGAIFLTLLVETPVATGLMIAGVLLALIATFMYGRAGMRKLA